MGLVRIAPEIDADDVLVPVGNETIDRSADHDGLLLQGLPAIVAAGSQKSADAMLALKPPVIGLRFSRLLIELPQRIHDVVETDWGAGANPQVRGRLHRTGV
jgi:hypothetical protein